VGGDLSFGSRSGLDAHTIGKYPALRLVSRLYHNGYNALDVYFRHLVLVVMLLLPSLTPFELICPVGQAFKA
jgi:hypothetical protein